MVRHFLQPAGAGTRLNLLEGLNTLGRNPTNDVRLSAASVSSFHCELEIDGDRVVVRDLQSTNGTRLNGVSVEQAAVRPGDELRLGELALVLDREVPVVTLLRPPPRPGTAPAAPSGPVRYQCARCHKLWEDGHLKRLKIGRDSEELRFCPACSGRCSPAHPERTAALPTAEPSLANRLTQTIQIGGRTK